MNTSTRQLALLGGGAGLGAGLMYLLDPQGGGRRRALARDKAVHAYHVSGDALRKSSVDLAHRSRGLLASAGSALHGDGVPDRVLAERVRSKLGRCVSHPHAIDVEAHDGCVVLRGEALTSEADHLLAKLAKVKGVHSLDNQLVLHDSTEGVPALQSGSSGRRRMNLPPAARLLAGTAGGALALAGLARMIRSTRATTAFARR
jgi:hypothetical protein